MLFFEEKQETVIDETEANLAETRIKMYSIIRENNDPEHCANNLLQLHLRPSEEVCF